MALIMKRGNDTANTQALCGEEIHINERCRRKEERSQQGHTHVHIESLGTRLRTLQCHNIGLLLCFR